MPRRRPLPALLLPLVVLVVLLPACRSGRGDEPPFRRVRPPVAFEMLRDSEDLPILDVRPDAEFHGSLGHLRGARNIPLAELPVRYLELLDLRNRTFLVYCQRDECEPAAMDFLLAYGFEDAMLIDGGIEAWRAAGFGTVGAGAPPEHEEDVRGPRPSLGGS
ncbi:MAG TPA: rhodanese-like domain-containing protein [Thermoanaerobaculia bacterium]|nr:rhodanese-like domain-containing protein [Thermoanaerobaculia bacterium]